MQRTTPMAKYVHESKMKTALKQSAPHSFFQQVVVWNSAVGSFHNW